jgi:hypothetical protein
VEYDIILANITAEDFPFHLCTPLLFPFLTTFYPKSQVVLKPLANDTQSQKVLKRKHYPLSKLKLVGIIAFPAHKSRDNLTPRQALACLEKFNTSFLDRLTFLKRCKIRYIQLFNFIFSLLLVYLYT